MYFYKDFVKPASNDQALNDLASIRTQIRSLIFTQGDLKGRKLTAIKKIYEDNPENLYTHIVEDITRGCIPGTNTLLRPALAALYNGGNLVAERALKSLLITQNPAEEADPILKSLSQGSLFARGIRFPSAIPNKTKEKLSTITLEDVRFNETNVQLEIRKILRNKVTVTASGKTGKLGFKNRSTSLIGWGANAYAPAGFLLDNHDSNAIKQVSEVNINSGFAKEKTLVATTKQKINNDLKRLQKLIKTGGQKVTIVGYTASHNEVIMDINLEMVVGIYYTLDSNLINAKYASSDGYPVHPNAPILEAIYIQKAYLKKTGVLLPTYEYSSNHNFVLKRSFTDAQIVDLWRNILLERWSVVILTLAKNETIPLIEHLKIKSMYVHCPYSNRMQALDINYDKALAEQILAAFLELFAEHGLFFVVATNDCEAVKNIDKLLCILDSEERIQYLNKTDAEGRTAISYTTSIQMLGVLQGMITPSKQDLLFLQNSIRSKIDGRCWDSISTLLLMGCDINGRDSSGDTPLTCAARSGWLDGVIGLLDKGADPAITDKDDLTPLSWALKKEQPAIVNIILQCEAERDRAIVAKRGNFPNLFNLFPKAAEPTRAIEPQSNPNQWFGD